MNIQHLITEGQHRKAIAKSKEEAQAQLYLETEKARLARDWQPILQRVAQCLPFELAHVLVTPEHSSQRGDIENRHDAEFVIRIPEKTGIYINCNPEIRWQKEPTFQAMHPVVAWDDFGDMGYYIRHEKRGTMTADFLIALAEAAEFAEKLPAAQADADARNAEWLAKEDEPQAEPAKAADHLADAIRILSIIDEDNAYQDHELFTRLAQTSALIAIAQELSRLNRLA